MLKRLAALFLLLMASAWPRISASTGTISYSIRTPSWLTTSSTTGATDTWGRHNHADGERECLEFAAGYLTYGPGVAFTNVSNGRGSATRAARLIVRCHRFLVRQAKSSVAAEATCLIATEDTCWTRWPPAGAMRRQASAQYNIDIISMAHSVHSSHLLAGRTGR